MSKPALPLIGGHVSASGGLLKAIENAQKIGAKTCQIFGSSPRQWAFRVPEPSSGKAFQKGCEEAGLGPVFLHAPYLINLGAKGELGKKSFAAMVGQMKIAEVLHARGVVVHVGTCEKGGVRADAISRSIVALEKVLKEAPGKAALVIENCAGGGERIGRDLAEIAHIARGIHSKRVGVCLDTAHAFEAGIAEYSKEGVRKLAAQIKATIGWERLFVIHANDSKTAFGSKHDRHENIGKGHIGLHGFRNLLKHPGFRKIPFILEVPGFDSLGPDKKNVDILKSL